MNEEIKTDNAIVAADEKKKVKLEIFIVIFLGLTAVFTAWASWQAALYGSRQDTKYTQSNAVISEANSMYNEAAQYLQQDMTLWNQIMGLQLDLAFAEENGDQSEVEKLSYKIDQIMYDSVGEDLMAAIEWADAQEEYASPFDMDGFVDSYFEGAQEKFAEGDELLASGMADNTSGDKLGLISVIYSVVLFLLGITSSFQSLKVRYAAVIISLVCFLGASAFMLTIPPLFF